MLIIKFWFHPERITPESVLGPRIQEREYDRSVR